VNRLGSRPTFSSAQPTKGLALNRKGQVVGWSEAQARGGPGGESRVAFLHSNGSLYDLNALLAPGSGWLLLDARRAADSPARAGPVPRWARATPALGAIRYVWLTRAAPPDARLLRALEVTLARSGLFGEVKEQMAAWAEAVGREHPDSVFFWSAPGVLDGLRLGPSTAAP
jgi:probable HAF family extracellular repeat protein